jgi:serine beta-lactamase-like protein LACTB, mitochondrial
MASFRAGRGWILVLVALLAAAIAGFLLFTGFSRQFLHPAPLAIPSAMRTDPPALWSEAVDRARGIVRAEIAAQNLPGVSVAVGAKGSIVWAEGFGWADIATRAPVTPDTRFRIGTASTMLTSAAVGVLLEKGRLRLDAQIQIYVPQFPKKQWPLTLRQLMAHMGGMGTDGGNDGTLFRQRCERPVEALPQFAPDALLFEPGTEYRHSKYGWILVSAAIEAASERPFLAFMEEQIFRPLGMGNTGAESATQENPEHVGEPEEDPPPLTFLREVILEPLGIVGPKPKPSTNLATVYLPGPFQNPYFRYSLREMRPHNLSCYVGSMAFFSTPSDLVRFGLSMEGGTLLQPATVQLLQASQHLRSGQETGYGLGWDARTVTLAGQSTQAAGHDGELRGRRVMSMKMLREKSIVVAVMSNASYADTSALATRVAEAFAPPPPSR